MTEQTAPDKPQSETRTFQAEVSRLLDIVAHSLYSEKEIFLRELISNASDACDRLRYAALTEPSLGEGDAHYRVVLTPVKSSRTLTIADNGIGMNRDELIENLGTIARSGTAAFVERADRRRQEGHEPDRPVRRRLLFGLHGRRQGRGAEPQGRRQRGLALGLRRPGQLHDRARRRRAARRPHHAAHARGRRGVSRAAPAAPDRQDLFRPHRAADRAGRRQQGRDDQHRLGPVDPAARRDHRRSSTRSSTTTSATASTTRG